MIAGYARAFKNLGSALSGGSSLSKNVLARAPRSLKIAAVGGTTAYAVHSVTHSKNLEQYLKSRYGEERGTESTSSLRTLGTLGSIGIAATTGMSVIGGMVGRGASMSAAKAGGSLFAKGASKALKGGANMMRSPIMPRKHPFMAAGVYGGAVGVGAGLMQTRLANSPISPEGRITGMGSGPNNGGIYAPLQFSTQGMPLRIHNNRRRIFI